MSDLSNIEGRVLAWLAGEDWKLRAFTAYDEGRGPDLYKATAGKILGKPADDVSKDERQKVGKVSELALGYQGGVGAFVTFATAYAVDLEDLAVTAYATLPSWAIEQATSLYAFMKEHKRPMLGLGEKTWIGIDAIKQSWRDAHAATSSLWKRVEDAARAAIDTEGFKVFAGRCTFERKGAWLTVTLPSGRVLCYPGARVDDTGKISYMGVNQYSRKWGRIHTYGGKLVENMTQAVARDVLAHGMLEAEAEGYAVVLSVHDELITETPDSADYSHERLSEIMSRNPPWADGLPLAAGGFEAKRYRKD